MSTLAMRHLARKHWAKWLPGRVADLKARGQLEQALNFAARKAQERVSELVDQGYRLYEAEEVALAEFILLKPEPDADLDEQEVADAEEREAAYQEMMREPPYDDD